jgi:D-alanyl-D-alanine dipeptidase
MSNTQTAPLTRITEATHDVEIDMMYARADNFTGQVIYDHDLCFLHPEAEACLRKAAAAARGFGFRLKIFDAFRPHEAQQALWKVLPVPGYVADPAKGSNHTRGVAVDLTLLDATGKELDMGTPVDTMTPASHHFHADLPAQVQLNRMYLMTIMLEAGFVHHAMEWWHYQLPDAKAFSLISSEAFAACLDAAG